MASCEMLGTNKNHRSQSRVLRACDSCTHSKQRCDGHDPCRRCAERKEPCNYTKAIRKRGRRPRLASSPNMKRDGQLSVPLGPSQVKLDRPNGMIPSREASVQESPRPFSLTGHRNDQLNIRSPADEVAPSSPSKTSNLSFTNSKSSLNDSISGHLGRAQLDVSQAATTSGHSSLGPDASLSSHQGIFDEVPNALPEPNLTGRSYRCLDSVLPYLQDVLSPTEAMEMLEVYFNDEHNSVFKSSSPYMLAHVLHPSSVLHPTSSRPISPALLAAIFFCVCQTADMRIFDTPGARGRMSMDLYRLSLSLLEREDPDNYFRTADGWQFHHSHQSSDSFESNPSSTPDLQASGKGLLPRQLGSTDFILAVAILTLVVSGGHYKADSLKWRDKLTRIVRASGLAMEDRDIDLGPVFCGLYNGDSTFKRWFIAKEERRRLFWLVYCLDRHLALSFNMRLNLPEGTFCVRTPLPEHLWQNLNTADPSCIPSCSLGPPTQISGTGFFEYFLPLAWVLGHIIDLHHNRNHPTLGEFISEKAICRVDSMISQRERELTELDAHSDLLMPGEPPTKLVLVKTYSTYLLHVFYILLHGKWDPISMIEDKDDWITSESFLTCASHALSATGVVSQILALDPEMAFMPYLFGIYLLQGSFILLLFVDRMPELGPNRSVEEVCETIIRAHEVSVVTLDTTFQKNFRKVFRSMLYDAQLAVPHSWDEHKARRRELLSLYRWTPLAHGLAY